jgi:hypothetical protein
MPIARTSTVFDQFGGLEMKTAKLTGPAKDGKATKSRGAQDDVELIKLILEEHPGLKKRILEKIRVVRGLRGTSTEKSSDKSENT